MTFQGMPCTLDRLELQSQLDCHKYLSGTIMINGKDRQIDCHSDRSCILSEDEGEESLRREMGSRHLGRRTQAKL